MLDTIRPGTDHGRIPADQLDWLDELAARRERARARVRSPPSVGSERPAERNDTYFGINPDDSEALCAVIRRVASDRAATSPATRTAIVSGASREARDVPIVEIACVKDYPGAWAEYRIHEGGYTQMVRRISDARRDELDREDTRDVRRPVPRLRARLARRPLLHASDMTWCHAGW